MNIKQLQYFVTIVENGTITARSEKAGHFPAAVERADEAAGGRIGCYADGAGREKQIRLTDGGKNFVPAGGFHCGIDRHHIKRIDRLSNRYFLACCGWALCLPAGSGLLKSKMAAFRNRFPDVCFEICEGNTLDLADQIQMG